MNRKFSVYFYRFVMALAITVGVGLNQTVADGDPEEEQLSPEVQAKLDKLKAFLANIDEFLPTVNLIPADRLPVTFGYEEVLDHIIVDVAFDDDEPIPLMFDTGAGTFVTQAVADAHGGEVLVEQGGAAGGGVILWNPLQVYSKITVGNALQIDKPTAITPWEADGSMYCVAKHGLFGAPAMRNAVWQIDYANKTLTAAASVDQLDHIEGAIAVPFTSKGLSPSPKVELGIGNGKLSFVVDTGGGIPMTINTADLAGVGVTIPEDAPYVDNLASGAGGLFASPMSFIDIPVDFGGTTLTVPVAVGDGMAPLTNGNIGHFFLRNFVTTFDWSTSTIYLDPNNEDGSVDPMPNPSAAAYAWAGGKIFVASIAAGGPAAEAGLTVGEVVTHIDGESIEDMDLDQFCKLTKSGERSQSLTTAAGKTYSTSEMKGFFDGSNSD